MDGIVVEFPRDGRRKFCVQGERVVEDCANGEEVVPKSEVGSLVVARYDAALAGWWTYGGRGVGVELLSFRSNASCAVARLGALTPVCAKRSQCT